MMVVVLGIVAAALVLKALDVTALVGPGICDVLDAAAVGAFFPWRSDNKRSGQMTANTTISYVMVALVAVVAVPAVAR